MYVFLYEATNCLVCSVSLLVGFLGLWRFPKAAPHRSFPTSTAILERCSRNLIPTALLTEDLCRQNTWFKVQTSSNSWSIPGMCWDVQVILLRKQVSLASCGWAWLSGPLGSIGRCNQNRAGRPKNFLMIYMINSYILTPTIQDRNVALIGALWCSIIWSILHGGLGRQNVVT